jgi:sulfide:quinone oxidoreductase
MIRLATLTPLLSVTSQLVEADVANAAARGFRSLINNRPDGEEQGQPSSAMIEAAARRAGLAYRHLPVTPGLIRDQDVEAMAAALLALPAPVLAFCRSGTRSATLWALTQAGALEPEAILRTCAAAGFALEPVRARLLARRRPDPSAHQWNG